MSTFRQLYYQIVFGTKDWQPTIDEANCIELYKYVSGIVEKKNCHLYRINGVEDHLHIFCDLHPSLALADFIKDIKLSSSLWMKSEGKFPKFRGWQEGYGAFTYNDREKDMLINYVKNQKEHHKRESSKDEFRRLLVENGIGFEEKYLF